MLTSVLASPRSLVLSAASVDSTPLLRFPRGPIGCPPAPRAPRPAPRAHPPPSPCSNWTRLVLPPVLSGHVSSFPPY